MQDDNAAISSLINDFYVVAASTQLASGKIRIALSSEWKGKTRGVTAVYVRLRGTDSLTGETIPDELINAKFSAVSTSYQSNPLALYGVYELIFDAELDHGEIIREFTSPQKLVLKSEAGKPFLRCRFGKMSSGWTELKLETNAPRRYSGKVMAKYGGHYQVMPELKGEDLCCYIPAKKTDVALVCSDASLPQPQKA